MEKRIKIIRNEIKSLLKDFTSEVLQKKAWLDREPSICLPPEEFYLMWGDIVIDDPQGYMIDKGFLTKEEWNILQEFQREMKHFFDCDFRKKFNNKPELLLEFEPWLKVRGKAKETLEKLGWN